MFYVLCGRRAILIECFGDLFIVFFFSVLSSFYNCLFSTLDLLILAELTICKASANVLHFLDSPIIFTIILLVFWKLMYYRINCMNIFSGIYSHCCACHSVETSGLNFILYGVYELRLQILFYVFDMNAVYAVGTVVCVCIIAIRSSLSASSLTLTLAHAHKHQELCNRVLWKRISQSEILHD